MPLLDAIVAQSDDLRPIRRDIHAHPELAFEETRTADLVAERLQAWGIPIHRGLGKTGVVGIIQGERPDNGRTVGLRADMDALPKIGRDTSELQSLMRNSYAVLCLKKKRTKPLSTAQTTDTRTD